MTPVVVLPTYEERENLRLIVPRVLEALPAARVLVVDDSSPDGTADVAREMAGADERVHLLLRPAKTGLGSAYKDAFAGLLARPDADPIVTMDADFSHDPAYLPQLVAMSERFDVVVGSRYAPGGGTQGWERWRRFLSWAGNRYAQAVTGAPVRDLTSGLVCFRRHVLERMDFSAISSSGYGYTIESKCLAWAQGARLAELPIVFEPRREGESKLTGGIVREGLVAPPASGDAVE